MKLVAEEKLIALEWRASQDAKAVTQLCMEWDELLQTTERLRSERGATHEECDQAVQEHDDM